jgi:hypothetical protein
MSVTKPLRVDREPSVSVSIALPLSYRRALVHYSIARGCSLSAIVRDLIGKEMRKRKLPTVKEQY